MSGKKCFNCGQPGHIARYCNANDDDDYDDDEDTRICYCCQQRGHIARDCPMKHSFSLLNPQREVGNNYQSSLNIQVRKGYLTNQNVDVIVVCSSSGGLRESILEAAGPHTKRVYEEMIVSAAAQGSFVLKCPHLRCKKIIFQEWKPCDYSLLNQQNLKSFMARAIHYVLSQNYKSVAFPSIGCGRFGLNPDFIAQTMVNHVKMENYPLNIEFIIHPQSHDVFQAFRNASTSSLIIHMLPDTLINTYNNDDLRFWIAKNSLEYDTIVAGFNQTMHRNYRRINGIERIQNERWHKQYLVHRDDFNKRLNMNTECFLYHGCSEMAADSIIKEYFNRSFAGKNGTTYGNGVYFSTRAGYSHTYAVPNARGERCMFFARVLVGYSTVGNTTMKVCPPNYHTTTDGDHIFVTYHDTQAYGQYLIHYQ